MSETPIARRVVERMRRQVRAKVADLSAFRAGAARAEELQKTVASPETLKELPLGHAMYAHVQNQMSVMAEQLLELAEMKPFVKVIGAAEDDYMPSWPPMSPITTSFFWCWSHLDVSVNAYRETLGSVTMAVAAEFGVHPAMLTMMRTFLDSRMGVYRVEGYRDSCVKLRDLVTDQPCTATCTSGYTGEAGELWFARVLPPPVSRPDDHVVFTSPYVLLLPDVMGWTQYFDRVASQDSRRSRIEALERDLKWGPTRRYWPEFLFEGYVNHCPGAIYLKGLPDIAASRPPL